MEHRSFSLASGSPAVAQDQLCLERLKDRLDLGVVLAIACPAHRCFETMFGQAFGSHAINIASHDPCGERTLLEVAVKPPSYQMRGAPDPDSCGCQQPSQ